MINLIEGQNLFSYETVSFPVPKGVTQIDGWNFDDDCPEGSGKSAILNIMMWVIEGKIPKDAKIDDVIREGQKSAVGAVHFNDGHIIVRSRKPNDLFIKTPEGEELRGKDARETQQLIRDLIGMSFETFCQCIYYPQNYENKFITASEENKSKILSEIQDLTPFDKARKEAQNKIKDLKKDILLKGKDLENAETLLNEIINSKKVVDELLDSFEESKAHELKGVQGALKSEKEALELLFEDKKNAEKKSPSEIKAKIEIIEGKIETFKESLQELRSKKDNIEAKKDTKRALERTLEGLKKAKGKTKEALEELTESSDNCPVCGGPLGDEHKEKLDKKISKLQKELKVNEAEYEEAKTKLENTEVPDSKALDSKIEKLKEKITIKKEKIEDLVDLLDEINDINKSIERKEESIKRLEANIYSIESKEPTKEKEQVELLVARIKKGKSVVKDLTNQYNALEKEFNDWEILKDGYKETKQYVFRGLLNDLSKKATTFLKELFEMPVAIRFYNEGDSGEASKILVEVTIDGVARPLGLYSGGQARRIQLAVDLALSQIIANRNQKPINFRAFDEPFKDLSEKSVESMCRLLQKLPGSTIIIEHNPFVKTLVDNQFWVELENGVSAQGEA